MTSGEGARIVDLISSFYVFPANLKAVWLGEGSKKEEESDKIEIALSEVRNILDKSTDSPRAAQRRDLVVLGRATGLIVKGDAYWWDFPHKHDGESEQDWAKRYTEWKREAPIPVWWQHLPAASTFPPSFGSADDEMLSTMEMTWYQLVEIFSDAELAKAGMPTDQKKRKGKVTLGIHSNRAFLTYEVFQVESPGFWSGKKNNIVRQIEHNMGRSAIRLWPGITSGQKEPGKYWLGVLFPARKLIAAADTRLSEAATASKYDSKPALKWWKNTDEDSAEGDNEVISEGDVIFLDPGDRAQGRDKEDIQPLIQPQFAEKTLTIAQFALERAAQVTGAFESLEGGFGPSGQSAWQRNFSAELAKGKLTPLTDGFVAMDVDVIDSIRRAIIAFDEPILFHGEAGAMRLTPKQLMGWGVGLKGDYQLRIPINKRADYSLGMELMAQRKAADAIGPSDPWILENLFGIMQPREMFKETLRWDFLKSDQMKNRLLKTSLDEADIELADEDEGLSIEALLAL
ncbi:MAG: hypothetical protein QGD93_11930, partial [Actinomycetota bacterium]|nr:hypothetical protein [Actinomycetota bacterium]